MKIIYTKSNQVKNLTVNLNRGADVISELILNDEVEILQVTIA